LVSTIKTEVSAVLNNNTTDNSVRRAIWVVLREVWGWVVKATTAVIMIVLEPWVDRAVVHSLEALEDLTVDLTAVVEALAVGRRF
jgi:hypothetical protein